jgi:muramidase (phage lysozyme)
MRFAALGGSNAGNYAQAGKAVADSAARTHAIQRKTGPNYGDLSKVAMQTNAEEKIAGIQASAKVAAVGINAYSNVTQMGQKVAVVNDKIDRFKKAKMAGSIAAIGKIAGAGFLAATDNTKGRERPKADYSSINSGFKKARDARMSEYDSEIDSLNSKPSVTPSNAGGSTPGKVTSGASTAPTSSTAGEGLSNGWAKWSRLIKAGEGTSGSNGYNTMFTGAQFSDTSKHPRQINSSNGLSSDAAGAYQFLSTTWDGAKNALGLTDFSPASQEKAGKYLAQQRGLQADTVFTDKASFLKELDKIAPEWASMPTVATGTSYYGQGGLTPDEAWRIYNGN